MKWPEDFVNKVINGEALEMLKKIPKESIDLCMTSPPYWGLRDYGVEQIFGGNVNSYRCKHLWGKRIIRKNRGSTGSTAKVSYHKKERQGVKSNLGQFCIACEAWKGQLGLEPTPEFYIKHLTEIFSEVKRVLKKEGTLWLNIGDTYSTHTGKRAGQFGKEIKDGFDDIYTRNRILPLQEKCLCMIPERLAWSLIHDGWILRNKIIWRKINHMPSSAKDRLTNAYEFVYLFSQSQKYYFDLDSVRQAYTEPLNRWGGGTIGIPKKTKWKSKDEKAKWAMSIRERQSRPNPLGKNPGDVWDINTRSLGDAHFATFPEELCEKPIKAGCPKGGIVMDPFCGIGTALFVANQLKRRFLGIDIKKEYCKMSDKKLSQGVLDV